MTESSILWRERQVAVWATCAAALAWARGEPWAWRLVAERWGFVAAPARQAAKGRTVVWLAVAPGGELLQCHTLCERLKAALPQHGLVLSTSDAGSVEVAQRLRGVDGVFFSPFDLPGPARRALGTLRPRLLVAVEAAWNAVLFREARAAGCTTVLLSGKMHSGYHRHPSYARAIGLRVFEQLDWIAAKTEEDREGFLALGVPRDRLRTLGDLRYDLEYLTTSVDERRRMRAALGLPEDAIVFVAGSTRRGEETIVVEAFLAARREVPSLRLVIAPRFLRDVSLIEEALRSRHQPFVRRTALHGASAGHQGVVILDTFGELPRLYGMADVTFVGGSILPEDRIGLGQNLVEPLAHRVPVFFGPLMNDWREATATLKAAWPRLEVRDAAELAAGIEALARAPELVDRLRKAADAFWAEKQSGVGKHVEFIRELLSSEDHPRPRIGRRAE